MKSICRMLWTPGLKTHISTVKQVMVFTIFAQTSTKKTQKFVIWRDESDHLTDTHPMSLGNTWWNRTRYVYDYYNDSCTGNVMKERGVTVSTDIGYIYSRQLNICLNYKALFNNSNFMLKSLLYEDWELLYKKMQINLEKSMSYIS